MALRAHVGLNLVFLVPGETGGMEVAARELILALVSLAPQVRFTAFVNREAARAGGGPWGELIPAVTVPVSARSRIQWVVGEQTLLPPLADRAGVELLHSLGSTAPGWGAARRVVTIHDLIYRRFPAAHAGLRDLGMRVLVPLAARRSDRVIATSQSTREDLIGELGLAPGKVEVIPLGLGSVRRGPPLEARTARVRFGLGERRVILSLSAKRPHKNLGALIGALGLIPLERRPVLVLPGYATWHESELRSRSRAAGVEDDVRFLSWLGESELEGLWGVSEAFVFPSLYEGFGLPVLEAMARGVPVACSDRSSLPEVAGGAALLFDPTREEAIAAAIERLLRDPTEAARLRAAGRARALEFTWERTARETLAVYERVLGPGGSRAPA